MGQEHCHAILVAEDVDLSTMPYLRVEDLVEGVGLPRADAEALIGGLHLLAEA